MTYDIKFKRSYWLFWRTLKLCGHNYDSKTDRMDLFLADNKGIYSIANWSAYNIRLGSDWMATQKEKMETEAGQSIPLKRNI